MNLDTFENIEALKLLIKDLQEQADTMDQTHFDDLIEFK